MQAPWKRHSLARGPRSTLPWKATSLTQSTWDGPSPLCPTRVLRAPATWPFPKLIPSVSVSLHITSASLPANPNTYDSRDSSATSWHLSRWSLSGWRLKSAQLLGGGESHRRKKLHSNTGVEPACSAVWSTRLLMKLLGHFLHCCRLLSEKQASGSLKDARWSLLLFFPFCYLLLAEL